MYASKPDKFLFIKSNKTAGTSLEIALSQCLANKPEQFFTPLSFNDEQLRKQLSGSTFSQTTCSIFNAKQSKTRLIHARLTTILNPLRTSPSPNKRRDDHRYETENFLLRTGFHTHSTYSECLNSYPELSEYWSCCFARHPYKRYLSHLTWRAKKIKNIKSWSTADWKSYAKRGINNFCKRNLLHYAYNKKNRTYVTAILAFETLKESTNLICEKISLEQDSLWVAMPKAKSRFSTAISNINPSELLEPDIRSKLLSNEEFLFQEMGYKDSLDDFMPTRTWIQTSNL